MGGRHVVEVAKGKVIIEDGKVVVVEEPKVKHCPVHLRLSGSAEISKESVRRAVELKIKDLGMFTPDRVVETKVELIPFGTSESLMSALKHGVIECAVVACDGAGTVITDKPTVVQGIGVRMTGLIETSPIKEVIEKLEERGAIVVDRVEAKIDQVRGVVKAIELGYKRIAVTITGQDVKEALRIRQLEKERGVDVAILVVHTSAISNEEARMLAENADVVCASASKAVREVIGPKAIMQIGLAIPDFVLTRRGKEIMLARLRDLDIPLLVGTTELPKIVEGPRPLI